jgi:RecG-like helicase
VSATDAERAGSRLRRALSELVAPKAEQEMLEARQSVADSGATPIASCEKGTRVTISGTLKSVSLRPRAGVPALEADLFDGTGHVQLVFLGRRRIAGIEPGRGITVQGRMTCHEDQPIVFNPRYELHPAPLP